LNDITIMLARWHTRFWAWLIDVLLIGIVWYLAIYSRQIVPFSLLGLLLFQVLSFSYWALLEGYRGQSLGKMALNLAVVGPKGERIGFKDSAIESFGKAFLLPLDLAAGLLIYKGANQRLLNRVSNTVVMAFADEGACSLLRP
jgi:uncharacterized RDD family membrane protein YckC